MIGEEAFAHVEDTRFRLLLSYWLGARAGRPVPPAGAIDPVRFAYALPLVWLCSVEENPRDFRYQLLGEHVRVAYDHYPRNRTLREITGKDVLDRVLGYFNRAVDEPAVVHVAGRIYAESTRPARGERILLPFADPQDGRVTRILGATVHSWEIQGYGAASAPDRQVRTFTPVDGRPAWTEDWL
jgi:hypothetical protein